MYNPKKRVCVRVFKIDFLFLSVVNAVPEIKHFVPEVEHRDGDTVAGNSIVSKRWQG